MHYSIMCIVSIVTSIQCEGCAVGSVHSTRYSIWYGILCVKSVSSVCQECVKSVLSVSSVSSVSNVC